MALGPGPWITSVPDNHNQFLSFYSCSLPVLNGFPCQDNCLSPSHPTPAKRWLTKILKLKIVHQRTEPQPFFAFIFFLASLSKCLKLFTSQNTLCRACLRGESPRRNGGKCGPRKAFNHNKNHQNRLDWCYRRGLKVPKKYILFPVPGTHQRAFSHSEI